MDIISYSIASGAAKKESSTRNVTLGKDLLEEHETLKERIDEIQNSLMLVLEDVDGIALQNSINILRAHQKLNIVAQSNKYQAHNLIFDDLLDYDGIDDEVSKNYTTQSYGIYTQEDCVIETTTEYINSKISNLVLIFNELLIDGCEISIDDGETWNPIIPKTIYTPPLEQETNHTELRLRIFPKSGQRLEYYGFLWG